MFKKIVLFSLFTLVLSSNAFANYCSDKDDHICGSSSNYINCIATEADISDLCRQYGKLVLRHPDCQKHDNEFDTLQCIKRLEQAT